MAVQFYFPLFSVISVWLIAFEFIGVYRRSPAANLYSGWSFASRITFAHFFPSARMNSRNSSGEALVAGSAPSLV